MVDAMVRGQIEKMKQWCMDNYNNGADTMVECWEDTDYGALLFENTNKDAWKMLRDIASIYLDQQNDARNSAF